MCLPIYFISGMRANIDPNMMQTAIQAGPNCAIQGWLQSAQLIACKAIVIIYLATISLKIWLQSSITPMWCQHTTVCKELEPILVFVFYNSSMHLSNLLTIWCEDLVLPYFCSTKTINRICYTYLQFAYTHNSFACESIYKWVMCSCRLNIRPFGNMFFTS